jgi:hypothetical protein
MATGRGYPRPERRRPSPRKPGWRAGLECANCQDRLLNILLPGKAFEPVTPSQVATALELVEETMRCSLWEGKYDPDAIVYRMGGGDVGWLRRAQKRIDADGTRVDAGLLGRLREITEAVPWDSAAVAALNMAKYVAWRFERRKLVTADV